MGVAHAGVWGHNMMSIMMVQIITIFGCGKKMHFVLVL